MKLETGNWVLHSNSVAGFLTGSGVNLGLRASFDSVSAGLGTPLEDRNPVSSFQFPVSMIQVPVSLR